MSVVNPVIRHAEVEGRRVLLDLRVGTYSVLDDVATTMWSALVGERGWGAARQELIGRYAVDGARLDGDYAAFRVRCAEDGLIGAPAAVAGAPPTAGKARGAVSGSLRAVRVLYETRYRLLRHGFAETYRRYAALGPVRGRGRLDDELRRFRRAEHLFVAREAPNDCLVRSLSLFRYLSEAGAPASHVIGIRRVPFQAHAWVESEGRPLLDDPERCGGYTPIALLACAPGL
jgi:hypothetical protein